MAKKKLDPLIIQLAQAILHKYILIKNINAQKINGIKNDGGIDNLLQSLGIDGLDKENHFNPNEDDISDWFGGAPGWLRRS